MSRIVPIHTSSVLDLNAGQIPGADRAGQPLFAQFGRTAGTSLVDGIGYSTYHSLQTQLNRRFPRGFQLGAAYTWSKVIGLCCEEENNAGPRIKALNYLDLNRTVLELGPHAQFADQRAYGNCRSVAAGKWNPGNGVARAHRQRLADQHADQHH